MRTEDVQLCLRRAQPPDQPGKGLADAAECRSYLAEVRKSHGMTSLADHAIVSCGTASIRRVRFSDRNRRNDTSRN